jgi:hypothetical protein
MTAAIVVSGNALRYVREARAMQRHLVEGLDINELDAVHLHGCDVTVKQLTERLDAALCEKTRRPLLLHFAGGASEHGWQLDDARSFPYFTLSDLLMAPHRPVLVVNDCDSAMSLRERLEDRGVSPQRVQVVGSTARAERALDRWLNAWLLRNWRKGVPHRLGPALSWGADLDAHFYSPADPG